MSDAKYTCCQGHSMVLIVESGEELDKSIKCKYCGRRSWLKGFGPSTYKKTRS